MTALVAGVGASVYLGEPASVHIAARTGLTGPWAKGLAHGLLFLGPYVALQAVGWILHRLGRAILLGGVDRLVGAVFGVATGVVLAGACLFAAERSGVKLPWLAEAELAGPLVEVFERALRLVRGLPW